MIVAGIDVGSLTAKALIMKDGEIIDFDIITVRPTPIQSAGDVMEKALNKTGLKMDDIDYCVSTGYGREQISFSRKSISEISCHGKGAHWCRASIRGVIDIGGQDCKAIIVDKDGNLDNFAMNDKCAAGTGRFLEIISKALGIDLAELGPLTFKSNNPLKIVRRCSVFAEYEVIFLLAEGKNITDIGAGVNEAMAQRAFSLAGNINLNNKLTGELTVTGGVAKNVGVIKNLEKLFDAEIVRLPLDPQIMGALGAALFARRYYEKEVRV
jgi:predicted CoA-substrate-specific enzyme activase